MYISIPQDPSQGRMDGAQKLERMLKCVDQCPVTRHQKLQIYKLGVCPRLNWSLTIHQFPLTWIERQLQPLATRSLKKWSGLAKLANPNLLYLSQKQGGLGLPSLASQEAPSVSPVPAPHICVRFIADNNLQCELSASRMKFRPATAVRDMMCKDPSQTQRSLARSTKPRVMTEDDTTLLQQLSDLPKQGRLVRSFTPDAATGMVNCHPITPSIHTQVCPQCCSRYLAT